MTRTDILRTARFAGQVMRYHTWPVHRQQSVGEHTWQCMRIYYQIWGPLPPALVAFMLFHDAGELVAGDPPFPVKAQNPRLKEEYDLIEAEALANMGVGSAIGTDPRYKDRAKICDLIEMCEFGLVERSMGNLYAQPIIDDTYAAIRKLSERMSPDDRHRVAKYLQGISL